MSDKNIPRVKYLADYFAREAEKYGSSMTDEGVRFAIMAEGIEAYESTHNCAVGEITNPADLLRCASELLPGSSGKLGRIYIPDNNYGIIQGYRTDEEMSELLYFLGDMLD